MDKQDIEDLNNASLDIRNAIDTIEWYEELQQVTNLLEEAERILDGFIMNEDDNE